MEVVAIVEVSVIPYPSSTGTPAGPEELEDLVRDRGGAGGGLAHAPAEDRAHVFEQALFGLREGRAQLLGDLFLAGEHVAHALAQLDRRLGAGAFLRRLRLDRAVGERVDLLEDPRHRRAGRSV